MGNLFRRKNYFRFHLIHDHFNANIGLDYLAIAEKNVRVQKKLSIKKLSQIRTARKLEPTIFNIERSEVAIIDIVRKVLFL